MEVNDEVTNEMIKKWKQRIVLSIASTTLSRSPEDNAHADALKRGWGLDSFPSILLLHRDRNHQVSIVACIEKDKNTSNPAVWENYLMAIASPGQVYRRKRSGDHDLLGGVQRAGEYGSWLQDDVTGLDPRSLATHAPWEQYFALETFGKEKEPKTEKSDVSAKGEKSETSTGAEKKTSSKSSSATKK